MSLARVLALMSDGVSMPGPRGTLTPTAKLLSLQAVTWAQKAGHSISKWQGWDLNANQHASVLPVCTQNLVHQGLGGVGRRERVRERTLKPGVQGVPAPLKPQQLRKKTEPGPLVGCENS